MPADGYRVKSGRAGRGATVAAVVALATVALPACGSHTAAKLPPKAAVAAGFSKLRAQSGVSIRITLGVTAAQIRQLASAHGGGGIPSNAAQGITESALVFSFETGNGEPLNSPQARKDANDRIDFGVQVGSSMPVEIRYIGQALYVRIQLASLLAAFGGSPDSATKFGTEMQHLNQYVPGLSALGQGNWVSLSKASLQPLLGLLKMFAKSGQGASAASAQALVNSISSAFKNNATYTSVGTSNGRDQYAVTVALQTLVQQVATAIETYASSVPGLSGKIDSSKIAAIASKVPAQMTLQLYTEGGKTQEVDVDVNQFLPPADKAPFAIPVRFQLSEPNGISAPSGATPLDLSKIGQLITGIVSGLGHSGSASISGSTTATG